MRDWRIAIKELDRHPRCARWRATFDYYTDCYHESISPQSTPSLWLSEIRDAARLVFWWGRLYDDYIDSELQSYDKYLDLACDAVDSLRTGLYSGISCGGVSLASVVDRLIETSAHAITLRRHPGTRSVRQSGDMSAFAGVYPASLCFYEQRVDFIETIIEINGLTMGGIQVGDDVIDEAEDLAQHTYTPVTNMTLMGLERPDHLIVNYISEGIKCFNEAMIMSSKLGLLSWNSAIVQWKSNLVNLRRIVEEEV